MANPLKKLKKQKKNNDIIINQVNIHINNTNNINKSVSRLKLKNSKSFYDNDKEKSTYINKLKLNNQKNFKYKQKKINIKFFNDFELNTMNYEDALVIDKRTYYQYYLSLLRTKHPIIFTFFPFKDYNLLLIKICLFFLSFAIYYFFNTLFFDYSIIHKIYEDQGNYNFSYLLPIIIYSFIISYYFNIIIKYITLSERNLVSLKNEKNIIKLNDKASNVQRCLIIKYILYFVISFIFLIFFWYYLSSFCAVYQNSQVYLIKNTFISFALSLIYPFIISLLPGFFRLYSLNDRNKKSQCLYLISKILQLL